MFSQPLYPDRLHSSSGCHHLSQCVLSPVKLLQQLLVLMLGSTLSILQFLPTLTQIYHLTEENMNRQLREQEYN